MGIRTVAQMLNLKTTTYNLFTDPMKKSYFLAVFLLVNATTLLRGQRHHVVSAWSSMSSYDNSKGTDYASLTKAKGFIDLATTNADTKDETKTWVYRGQIYLRLYQHDYNNAMVKHKDITDGDKKSTAAFYETPTASLTEAANAFMKAGKLDVKNIYEGDITNGLNDIYYKAQRIAIAHANQQKFNEALPFFEMAIDITSSFKKVDTVNISNAATTAANAKNYAKSVTYYKRLTEMKYGKGSTWSLLANSHLSKGDSVAYRQTIAEGLKLYPSDQDLLVEDVNIKMAEGRDAEAILQLNTLIAQRPDDANLNFVVGNVYDRLANPKNPDGTDALKPKAYEELFTKAELYYKKAIELSPNDLYANYNLGVLYYNQSVYYYQMSQESITEAVKYKDIWQKPLPDAAKYLEIAHKLDAKDLNTLQALKACYAQMSDTENYQRIKDEIKALQTGK